MKTDTGYVVRICGKRGNMLVEDVYFELKKHSTEFETTSVEHNDGAVSTTDERGKGSIQGIPFTYRYFTASMGIPSLDIYIKKWSEDRDVRDIIHSFGWKGNQGKKN